MASNEPSRASPPRSPTGESSRHSSVSTQGQPFRPLVSSGLRQTHIPPATPEEARILNPGQDEPEVGEHGVDPFMQDDVPADSGPFAADVQGDIDEPPEQSHAHSELLGDEHKYHIHSVHDCGEDECRHGTFSPRPRYRRGFGSFATYGTFGSNTPREGYGGPPEDDTNKSGGTFRDDVVEDTLGEAVTDGLLGHPTKSNTTHSLAKRHGVKHERLMFLFYYVPVTNWIRQYKWSYLQGDFIAALTMASFYIPISLSYASNLGHIPPINGLYSFVFNPLIYAILGTCPQMVVGPEAAGSLLTGGVVREAINTGYNQDHDGTKNAQIAGMVASLSGAIILAAGLCRLGFLDSVLSRPFLRGFISAIGIVILVDQLIPEMGLDTAAAHSRRGSHGSSLDKILFLADHSHEAHHLTCAVSFSTIAIVLVLREIKRRLQPRMNWVAYVPDRFIVVVLSAVLSWRLGWEQKGVDILGDIKAKGRPFQASFPFDAHRFTHVHDIFSTAFVIALLGFFESSVAAKALGTGTGKVKKVKKNDGKEVEEAEGLKGITVSANRELVALGVANLLGGTFMSLPAFGGYGRSKVNSSTGGKTPMSSVFLSLITVICVLFLLPYFYYIPKGVLSAMISVVAYSLIEEAPHDIIFFYRISGWIELGLMLLIFLTTFFWNLRIGISVGIGLSLLRLLRHATKPRIQILGRVPGTRDFENAEMIPESVEFVPHCLIVKIPEPLTFANTGSLKDRLKRLEDHGTSSAHPALPRVRSQEHNQNIIFDIHGVTSMDPAASQVLLEIVKDYIDRGTRVFFCRVPGKKSDVWRLLNVTGIVELCGGEENFLRSVDEALQATEKSGAFSEDWDEEAMVGEGVQTESGVGDEVAGIRSRMVSKNDDGEGEQPERGPIAEDTEATGSDSNSKSR